MYYLNHDKGRILITIIKKGIKYHFFTNRLALDKLLKTRNIKSLIEGNYEVKDKSDKFLKVKENKKHGEFSGFVDIDYIPDEVSQVLLTYNDDDKKYTVEFTKNKHTGGYSVTDFRKLKVRLSKNQVITVIIIIIILFIFVYFIMCKKREFMEIKLGNQTDVSSWVPRDTSYEKNRIMLVRYHDDL